MRADERKKLVFAVTIAAALALVFRWASATPPSGEPAAGRALEPAAHGAACMDLFEDREDLIACSDLSFSAERAAMCKAGFTAAATKRPERLTCVRWKQADAAVAACMSLASTVKGRLDCGRRFQRIPSAAPVCRDLPTDEWRLTCAAELGDHVPAAACATACFKLKALVSTDGTMDVPRTIINCLRRQSDAELVEACIAGFDTLRWQVDCLQLPAELRDVTRVRACTREANLSGNEWRLKCIKRRADPERVRGCASYPDDAARARCAHWHS